MVGAVSRSHPQKLPQREDQVFLVLTLVIGAMTGPRCLGVRAAAEC